ncbi:hypothetical protein BDV12DRAFT_122677 [Aspergillus spectabilis]
MIRDLALPCLLGQLTGLKDLIWACKALFLPFSLKVLSEKAFSGCRLHNMMLKSSSLHLDHYLEPRRDVDPYEFSLATSPNVTSILAPAYRVYGLTGIEFKQEVAPELLKLAPNIKHVHILRLYPHFGSVPPNMLDRMRNWPRWHGFFVDECRQEEESKNVNVRPSHSPSHIHTLSIAPANDAAYFRNWKDHSLLSLS